MLVNLISFVSFGLFAWIVFRIGNGIQRGADVDGGESATAGVESVQTLYQPAGPWMTTLANVVPLRSSARDSLKKELVRAGYYRPATLNHFLGTRNMVTMSWILFVAVVLVVMPDHHRIYQSQCIWGGLVVTLLLFGLPRIILSGQANGRSRRIEKALPDALDMITMTVAGGVSMRDAMRHVRSEMQMSHRDLADELRIIEKQADAGTLANALDRFAQRVDLPDVTGLAALIKQNDRLGGQVVDTLRTYSDDVRQKRRQLAEESGNKASIKLLLPVIFCLAPPIYILLLGPAVIELRDFMTRENEVGGVLRQSVASSAPVRPGADAITP